MTVFLLILKILGIILLTILGIVILVAGCILFVPIRYKAQYYHQEELRFTVRAGWLFRIIFYKGEYQKEFHGEWKIFGISRSKKNKKNRNKKKNKKIELEESVVHSPLPEKEQIIEELEKKKIEEKIEHKKKKQKKRKGPSFVIIYLKNLWKRFKDFIKRMKGFVKQIKQGIQAILDEENQEAFLLAVTHARKLVRHYGPRRMKGSVFFGFSDPSYTGLTAGFVSLFPIIHRNKVEITPDFSSESFYVKGEVVFSGRIQLIHLLRSAIVLLKNEKIRHIVFSRK